MSIALMTLAFKAALPTTQKFVLVALCDSANDQGECYPSVPTLMLKCSLGDRAIQGALNALEKAGVLRREFRTGRSTIYWVTPAECAPRSECPPQIMRGTPAADAPPPPQIVHPTPAADAPITVIEPSREPSGNQKKKKAPAETVSPELLIGAGFDQATAEEFIAVKAERKAPLTPRAWADHLSEARKAGWSPMAAAEKVMAKTWKGFEAKYVASEARPGGYGAGPPVSKQAALEARNRAVAEEYMRENQ